MHAVNFFTTEWENLVSLHHAHVWEVFLVKDCGLKLVWENRCDHSPIWLAHVSKGLVTNATFQISDTPAPLGQICQSYI